MPTPSPRSPRSHASDTCARLTMRRSTGVSSVSRLTPLEQSAPQLGAPSETLLAEPLLACLKTEASDRVEARGAPQHSVQATPMRSHINRTAISEDCARWHALRPAGSPPAQPCHPASSPSSAPSRRFPQSNDWPREPIDLFIRTPLSGPPCSTEYYR